MPRQTIRHIHFGLKPLILVALLVLGFIFIIPLEQPLWGFVFFLCAGIYGAFTIKPIYAVFALLIIRPALDQYSSYLNLEITGPPRLVIEGNFLFSIISIIFTLIVIVILLAERKQGLAAGSRLLRNKTFWVLVLLLIIAGSSVAYSIFQRPSQMEMGRLVSIMLYFVVGYLYVANYKKFREFSYAIYFAAVIPFFVALTQLVTGTGVISNIGEQSRIYGTFAHPSHLAIFAFIVLGVAVANYLRTYNLTKKIDKVSLGFALAGAVMLLLTSSRTALGALVVFALILGLAKYRKTLLVVLAALVVFVLLYSPLYQRLESAFDTSIYSSGRWRLDYWHDMYTFRVTERPVLGHGTGSAIYVAESLYGPTEELYSYDPHNDYLLMLMELGYAGLIVYVLLFLSIIFALGKHLRASKDDRSFTLALLGLVVGIALISALDNVFRGTAIYIAWLTIVGAALGYVQSHTNAKSLRSNSNLPKV